MADQFKFAEAYTELTMRDSQFHAGVRKATFSLQKLQRNLESVARHARRMLLIGGAALAGFVKLASDAEQTALKFNSVFKDGADEARAWSEALAKAVGRSKFAIQEGLATFQSFFIGLGFGADAATRMSKRMQGLSIDFASFNNIADSEATQRFISALSGSAEVLDLFGINLKQSALDQELLNSGFEGGADKANEMQKALARVAIIAKAMGQQGALGDAVRTGGSLSNQMAELTSLAKGLAIEIGTAFIPVMQRLVTRLKAWSDGMRDLVRGNEEGLVSITLFTGALLVIVSIAPKVVGALMLIGKAAILLGGGVAMGGLIGLLAVSVAALGAAWASAAIQGKEFGDTVLEIADAMGLLTDEQVRANKAAKGDPFVQNKQQAARVAAASEAARAKGLADEKAGIGPSAKTAAIQAELEVARQDLERAERALTAAEAPGERDRARAKELRAELFNLQREIDATEGIVNVERGTLIRRKRAPLRELERIEARLEESAQRQAQRRRIDPDPAFFTPEALQRSLEANRVPELRAAQANVGIAQQRVDRLAQAAAFARAQDEIQRQIAGPNAARAAQQERNRINEEREAEEDRFGRDQMFDRRMAEEKEAKAIQLENRRREAQERGFGAEQDEAATAQARRLRRPPGQVAQMGMSSVQGFVQQLLNQPPRPEDVERNRLLKELNEGLGEKGAIVKAVKNQPGPVFQ